MAGPWRTASARPNPSKHNLSLKKLMDDTLGEVRKTDQSFFAFANDIFCQESLVVFAYGLGSISMSPIARHQVVCLQQIKAKLAFIYDPIFTEEEWAYFKDVLKYKQISFPPSQNIKVSSNETVKNVLFYMPHCDLPVYNEILEWILNFKTDFFKCYLVCNDFCGYSRARLLKEAPLIAESLQRFIVLRRLDGYRGRHDVFNDTVFGKFE